MEDRQNAYAAIAAAFGDDAAAAVRELVQSQADADAILVLRAPDAPAADPVLRPGERIIGGRRFYSADWL